MDLDFQNMTGETALGRTNGSHRHPTSPALLRWPSSARSLYTASSQHFELQSGRLPWLPQPLKSLRRPECPHSQSRRPPDSPSWGLCISLSIKGTALHIKGLQMEGLQKSDALFRCKGTHHTACLIPLAFADSSPTAFYLVSLCFVCVLCSTCQQQNSSRACISATNCSHSGFILEA